MQGSSMEEFVLCHPVHLALLCVEVLQQAWSRGFPAYSQQVVDFLYGFEGFLLTQNNETTTKKG